jgi:hypothetical protein
LGLDNLPDGVTTGRPAIACWSAFAQGAFKPIEQCSLGSADDRHRPVLCRPQAAKGDLTFTG